MAQPQPQVPQRTFSPASQLSPSPAPHAAGFSGQPPSKKQRLSPAPSPTGASQSPTGVFSPLVPNGSLHNSNSPATPSTPNSLASPLALPPTNAQSAAAPPAPPLPTSALPNSGAASPMLMPSPLPMPSPSPTAAQALATTNGGSPHKLQMSAASPASQVASPKPAQTPTPPTPAGPPTPLSGPPLPQIAPAGTPGVTAPAAQGFFVPGASYPAFSAPTGGAMGPPSKPPTKEYQYEVDDLLAGTGIDLRQEEQFQANYFAGTYRPEARTGFPANAPGGRGSFYGSLSANQPAETIDEANQRKFELEAAKHTWTEAARTLASSRSNALHNRFLEFGAVFLKAEKIAHEYGIGVAMDPKTAPPTSARARHEPEFPTPSVTVTTRKGPDGVSFVSTTETYVPEDSLLADQLALLSLATKHRLRELLEDANKVAEIRQRTSHGVVPDEWLEAAAPLPPAGAAAAAKGSKKSADEGKGSLKRPLEADGATELGNVAKKIAASNTLIQSLRAVCKTERSIEEQRLLKRQKREEKKTDATAPATPAANRTAAPGTPGSVAPEPDKAPTKKDLKKHAAAKVAEQNDTLSANRTSMAFLGGRKKQYSWLSGGAGASPKRGAAGAGAGGAAAGGGTGGSGSSTPGRRPGEPATLTAEGRTKWGSWREDGIKGKDIQLRDLVVVLEADGREAVALQTAYDRLDGMPLPKPTT